MAERVRERDVAIIGSGPAGLSAAIELGRLGVDAVVMDEKPRAGGQLFKQIHKFFGSERHMAGVRGFEIGEQLIETCGELGVPILLNCPVWGVDRDMTVGAIHQGEPLTVRARQVILATGASENSLAFPGWTLPGVMGAGAAQTLVNYHRVRPGDRALVVGGGNVGLIVSYQLLQAGIDVAAVAEATASVGGYMVHAAKIRRMGVPLHMNHTILSAEGDGRVERCTIARIDDRFQPVAGSEQAFDVDLVCLSVGLSPAIDLCGALGACLAHVGELGGWLPLHDRGLRTSLAGVHVAGDVAGIEEASTAMEEGRLAAVSAAHSLGRLSDEWAEDASRQIQRSLADLRRGPFGDAVGRCKQSLYRRFEEECRTIASST